jgi:hypothetical protein
MKNILPKPNPEFAKEVPVDPEKHKKHEKRMTDELRYRLENTNEPTRLPEGMAKRMLETHLRIVKESQNSK